MVHFTHEIGILSLFSHYQMWMQSTKSILSFFLWVWFHGLLFILCVYILIVGYTCTHWVLNPRTHRTLALIVVFALFLIFLGLMHALQLVGEVVGSRSIGCVCYQPPQHPPPLPKKKKRISRIDAHKKNPGPMDLLFWVHPPLSFFDYAKAVSIQESMIWSFSLILLP